MPKFIIDIEIPDYELEFKEDSTIEYSELIAAYIGTIVDALEAYPYIGSELIKVNNIKESNETT